MTKYSQQPLPFVPQREVPCPRHFETGYMYDKHAAFKGRRNFPVPCDARAVFNCAQLFRSVLKGYDRPRRSLRHKSADRCNLS